MFPFDSREFQVKYRPTGGFTVQQEAMKDVTVTLKRDQSVRQQIHNLIRANDMPLYIQVPLISAFDGWIEQNQQLQHPNWPQHASSCQEHVQQWKELFISNTLAFTKKTEPKFPKAFHYLATTALHSKVFDMLLQVENVYRLSIYELAAKRDQEASEFKKNVDSSEDSTISQSEMIDTFIVQWNLRIEEQKQLHKEEFQDFVTKIYEEIESRIQTFQEEARVDGTASESKDADVSNAIKKLGRKASREIMKFANEDHNVQASISGTTPLGHDDAEETQSAVDAKINSTAVDGNEEPIKTGQNQTAKLSKSISLTEFPSSAPKTEDNPILEEAVKEISEMGFEPIEIRAALDISKNDKERAIILLLENPKMVKEHMRSKESAKQNHTPIDTPEHATSPLKKSNSILSFSTTSNTRGNAETSPPVNTSSSALISSKKRSFSFTRSLFSNGPGQTAHAAPPKHGPSPLTKVGSFLEKALEAFRIEDGEKKDSLHGETKIPYYSESFTVHFGSQIRLMYHMMLHTQSTVDLFTPASDSVQEMALRAQKNTALYSQSLSGVIVLLRSKDFTGYADGLTANTDLISRCCSSADLHFESIHQQLQSISDALPKDESGNHILEEGDFFVTKHSNLPTFHLVFHLIYDEEGINKEFNSRSQLINGYRSILHSANTCNVHHLTLPLLLLPEHDILHAPVSLAKEEPRLRMGLLTRNTSTASLQPTAMSDTSILKRAEVILKQTKGLLTEHSRALKHTGGVSAGDKYSRSLVFVIPRQLPSTEHTFLAVRERLTDVFRTS